MVKVLESRGHQVKAVASAEEALALLKDDGRPGDRPSRMDLLLTDLVLRGAVEGPALVEKMRTRWPGLPVVYMSGSTRQAALSAGWPLQGEHYLEKPFTPERLVLEVENALESATPGHSPGLRVSVTIDNDH